MGAQASSAVKRWMVRLPRTASARSLPCPARTRFTCQAVTVRIRCCMFTTWLIVAVAGAAEVALPDGQTLQGKRTPTGLTLTDGNPVTVRSTSTDGCVEPLARSTSIALSDGQYFLARPSLADSRRLTAEVTCGLVTIPAVSLASPNALEVYRTGLRSSRRAREARTVAVFALVGGGLAGAVALGIAVDKQTGSVRGT